MAKDWSSYREAKAAGLMERVKAGEPLRQLIGGRGGGGSFWTASGLRRYRAKHPEWSAELTRVALENGKQKVIAANARRVAAKTHCVNGHAFTPENTGFKRFDRSNRLGRFCRACSRIDAAKVRPMTEQKVARVVELVGQGVPLHKIYGKAGAGVTYVTNYQNIMHQRLIDPGFDRLIAEAVSRGLAASAAPERMALMRRRKITIRARREAEEYRAIRAMVPTTLPDHDDIVQNILRAIHEGSLRRDQVKERVRFFVTEQHRMFPPKFAKFGRARLLSLDAVMFEDGSTTIGDTVSEGFW